MILLADFNTPYQGTTDINGQITFSDQDLTGVQTITASAAGFTTGTITTVDSEARCNSTAPVEPGGGRGGCFNHKICRVPN